MSKFDKQQRVTVPGLQAQGVILDITEGIQNFPVYTLRWLDEAGESHTGTCGEGDLADANPSDDDLLEAQNDLAKQEDALEHLVNLRVKAALSDRARQRRKASSKRKRRR